MTNSKAQTIFGREPAVWVGLIEAALAFLSSVVLHLSQGQVGAVMAVVVALFGVYTAWATKDTLLGYLVGLIKAVLALFLGFGVHLLSPEQAASLIGLVTVALAFYQRTQTSPVGVPLPVNPTVQPVYVPEVIDSTSVDTTVNTTVNDSAAAMVAESDPYVGTHLARNADGSIGGGV